MTERPLHLVERVAARLRAGAAPAAPAAAVPDVTGIGVASMGVASVGADGVAAADPQAADPAAADFVADSPPPFAPPAFAPPAFAPPAFAPPASAPAGFAPAGFAPAAVPASPAPAAPVPAGAPYLDIAALKRGGLALAGVRSRVTEEYRIAVGRILRALRAANRSGPGTANLVMVTSARPGEGKSFSALNLAASVAQNGLADVLLVDIDAKPRSLSTLLGLREQRGLLDLVDQPELRAEDLLVRTAIEGLQLMPLGAARAGSADQGVTRALATAIERIRRRFTHHVVILDSAPCLSTSDPSTLAPLVDQVIMVVEAGRTQRAELGAALELVRGCPNVLLMLNKVRLTHRHSFGSYYYFGYPS